MAFTHAQSRCGTWASRATTRVLFERLASRVFGTDGSLRADAEALAANTLGQPGLWAHGISGDLPIVLRARHGR